MVPLFETEPALASVADHAGGQWVWVEEPKVYKTKGKGKGKGVKGGKAKSKGKRNLGLDVFFRGHILMAVFNIDMDFLICNDAYPLVNSHITMEHHHFSWENSLEMVIFHS